MKWPRVNVLLDGPETRPTQEGHYAVCDCGGVSFCLFYMQLPSQLHVQCYACGRITCLHPEPCCEVETYTLAQDGDTSAIQDWDSTGDGGTVFPI
jgi:hypothetical protein